MCQHAAQAVQTLKGKDGLQIHLQVKIGVYRQNIFGSGAIDCLYTEKDSGSDYESCLGHVQCLIGIIDMVHRHCYFMNLTKFVKLINNIS